MTEMLREWIIGLAGAALLTAVAGVLTPEGKVKRTVRLVCAVATILALIRPVLAFDYDSFSGYTAQFRTDGAIYAGQLESVSDSLSRRIIEEECAAYILDKASACGIADLAVDVTLRWSTDGYWYPESVQLNGSAGAEQRQALMYDVEAELGIPVERQVWSSVDETG